MYDYIIVGSGLFGAVCANELKKLNKKVLVIEKRNHIGGNAYTEDCEGIQIHKYGAHIFHTNDKDIWNYVNDLVEFNRFTNSPLAIYKDKLFNLPFNMNTFHQMWGVKDPQEAQNIINAQKKKYGDKVPENLEEQAISLVGEDLYQALIKGYTEKQWGRSAKELPAFIIKRIPVRFTFDNNYFSDRYQGIPVGGYTKLIEKMLEGVEVKLGIDFLKDKESLASKAHKIIYTGPIDQYFDYRFGELEYRSLKFETERHEIPNFQGNAVINFTDAHVPYTRIIEHKHFDYVETKHTVVTKEYPLEWKVGDEPYYPVNDNKNMELFKKYRELASREDKVIFGGRLAEYKYYDMHQVISAALYQVKNIMSTD
ncbi:MULTISPECIES: UDP-galactopyranose mutase [Enterobacter cloacae complex]|uniref:UDP-galactopyranose mutase n=1 Tax=Enterobacter cloacae complex TaxID=354276 RepID=UPI001A29B46A|nr:MULTISPECIES: UDP-galactopyranose mutase [Enterobacter cloacae complex]MCU3441851.1 UDP-galactopyranose mutase [Enterobacter asburiae]WJS49563.1 UDP-galactopyranose mutase [Enterobacter roggenkampii]HAT7486850.1 UDP-galactopyranose mutase [Enterobacter asburiae]HAT7507617.1 UDP-galactopyranose mutase [Enterobacter asburiae]HDR2869249.1 UDP-galactopyranose mutase [Enterobacter asburiae]